MNSAMAANGTRKLARVLDLLIGPTGTGVMASAFSDAGHAISANVRLVRYNPALRC